MTLVSPYLLTITINVNELNSPSKCIEFLWITKQNPIYMITTRDSHQLKETYRQK